MHQRQCACGRTCKITFSTTTSSKLPVVGPWFSFQLHPANKVSYFLLLCHCCLLIVVTLLNQLVSTCLHIIPHVTRHIFHIHLTTLPCDYMHTLVITQLYSYYWRTVIDHYADYRLSLPSIRAASASSITFQYQIYSLPYLWHIISKMALVSVATPCLTQSFILQRRYFLIQLLC